MGLETVWLRFHTSSSKSEPQINRQAVALLETLSVAGRLANSERRLLCRRLRRVLFFIT